MGNKNSITKHNALITACYRLSLTEMQIVVYGASLINPLKEDFPLKYKINISEFAQMFGRNHTKMYFDLKEIVFNRFWDREFTFVDELNHKVKARWLTTVKYLDGTGFFEVYFNPEIKEHLHKIQKNFTTYYVEQVAKFRSFYSVRMYEICIMQANKSHVNKSYFKLTISEIKEIFDVSDKYKRVCDFKQRILEPVKKEINKYSNIKISYEIIKQGRTPYEIKFSVTKRETSIKDNAPDIVIDKPYLSPTIIETGKEIAIKAGTGWDIYDIVEQFYKHYERKKELLDNPAGTFRNFVEKKVRTPP